MVVDPRKAQVFKRQMTKSLNGILDANSAGLNLV